MRIHIESIGRVESTLKDPTTAPRQADEGAPEAWLIFEPHVAAGLRGIKAGTEVLLLTWLDRAHRSVLVVQPRGDASRPPEGVFNTRSPHRPNPIGLHRVKVAEVDGLRVRVKHLEAIDGTPIIDVKAVLSEDVAKR